MKSADVRSFALRDWDRIARLKADHWARFKRRRGAGAGIRVGEELRRHARAVHPDWPTPLERRRDLAVHARVGAALRRVGSISAR